MRVLVFDTETTGLPLHPDAPLNQQPRIIEWGAAMIDSATGEEIETWEFLINPGIKLEAIITKITGLTDDDLADKPKFADVWPDIRDSIQSAGAVVAHNAPFDTSLVEFELARMGIKDFQWPRVICTVQETAEEWGKFPKLIQLYQHLTGEEYAQTHRALDDVRALARCVNIMEIFKNVGQGRKPTRKTVR